MSVLNWIGWGLIASLLVAIGFGRACLKDEDEGDE